MRWFLFSSVFLLKWLENEKKHLKWNSNKTVSSLETNEILCNWRKGIKEGINAFDENILGENILRSPSGPFPKQWLVIKSLVKVLKNVSKGFFAIFLPSVWHLQIIFVEGFLELCQWGLSYLSFIGLLLFSRHRLCTIPRLNRRESVPVRWRYLTNMSLRASKIEGGLGWRDRFAFVV